MILQGRAFRTSLPQSVHSSLVGGYPASEMLRRVDHVRVQDVLTAHSTFTNAIKKVSRLLVDEVNYGNRLFLNGWRGVQRPEQRAP